MSRITTILVTCACGEQIEFEGRAVISAMELEDRLRENGWTDDDHCPECKERLEHIRRRDQHADDQYEKHRQAGIDH